MADQKKPMEYAEALQCITAALKAMNHIPEDIRNNVLDTLIGDRKQPMMVKPIENGTVLDHIPANTLTDVISALKLNARGIKWTAGNNFASKKVSGGFKSFIKVADYFFKQEELYLISLLAPDVTVNVIKDSTNTKYKPEMPQHIENLVGCENPKCITNKPREPFSTSFEVSKAADDMVRLRCKYCEKITTQIRLR